MSLLTADDVGLGKTVEAGLITRELILRNQANKVPPVEISGVHGDGPCWPSTRRLLRPDSRSQLTGSRLPNQIV